MVVARVHSARVSRALRLDFIGVGAWVASSSQRSEMPSARGVLIRCEDGVVAGLCKTALCQSEEARLASGKAFG